MKTLDEIALQYGTDKSSAVHNYTRYYSKYFGSFREEPINLLEIGVQTGASLRMWKEYFPNAQIYGLDYYDCQPFLEERINVFQGQQSDPRVLEEVAKIPFDVIIDDGSHKNIDVVTSFEYLFPRMRVGGLYVIEDLNVCYWGDTHNVGEPIAIDRMKKLVDDVMSGGKSGIGDNLKDQADGEYKKKGHTMTWWEKNVMFAHFYRSMAFIARSGLSY